MNKKPEILYGFFYTDNFYDGGAVLQSLHRTFKGAQAAKRNHRFKLIDEWNVTYRYDDPPHRFGKYDRWYVEKVEIQEP